MDNMIIWDHKDKRITWREEKHHWEIYYKHSKVTKHTTNIKVIIKSVRFSVRYE